MTPCLAVAPTAAAPTPTLAERLAPFAENARYTLAPRLPELAKLRERPARADYAQYAQTAAFLAFVGLDGDPDAPEAFDWAGQAERLRKETIRELKRALFGRESDIWDAACRDSARRDGAAVEGVRWSAWDQEPGAPLARGWGMSSGNAPSDRDGHSVGGDRFQQRAVYAARRDEAELAERLQRLLPVLRDVLAPEQYRILVGYYLDDKSQHALAAELVATNAAYQGPGGHARAVNRVNSALSKARKNAAARLGQEWRELAREVA